MAADALQGTDLRWLAERVGTPFYVYDAAMVQARIDAIVALTAAPGLQARYAMKACSAAPILARMRAHQIWIDAVSGNEVLRAQAAGYPLGLRSLRSCSRPTCSGIMPWTSYASMGCCPTSAPRTCSTNWQQRAIGARWGYV